MKIKKIHELENEMLEIIDNRDDFTRSDLQGVVCAFITKIQKQNIIEQGYKEFEHSSGNTVYCKSNLSEYSTATEFIIHEYENNKQVKDIINNLD